MFGIIAGAVGALISGAIAVTKALAVVGLAVQGLKVIGNAIATIAKALGIIKPERDIEEVGDRALQAEENGMTPDKYPSYEAWIRAIEEDDWGYDPEKNKDMDPKEKILKGIEISSAVTMEKFPSLPIQDFFTVAASKPDFFTVERMAEISKMAATDVESFEKIVSYVTGATKDRTIIGEASDLLMNIEMNLTPEMSEDAAYDKVALFYSNK